MRSLLSIGAKEWELVEFTHNLPERRDPKDSSVPIPFEDILKAGKKSPDEITAIQQEAAADRFMEEAL